LPVPCGNTTVPRTSWSEWRGSTPRCDETTMVSSNLARAVCLTSFTASARSLIRPGFRCVSQHSSAEEALESLPAVRPQVVLMDINLPGMSGVDCIHSLKTLLPDAQIVMLTVYEDTDLIFGALSAGATGYLLKQSAANDLIKAIQEVNKGRTFYSPAIQKLAEAAKSGKEIKWARVYEIPSFVSFSHKSHLDGGNKCEECHGQVAQREKLDREGDISMGACMTCHQAKKVSFDCGFCHEPR